MSQELHHRKLTPRRLCSRHSKPLLSCSESANLTSQFYLLWTLPTRFRRRVYLKNTSAHRGSYWQVTLQTNFTHRITHIMSDQKPLFCIFSRHILRCGRWVVFYTLLFFSATGKAISNSIIISDNKWKALLCGTSLNVILLETVILSYELKNEFHMHSHKLQLVLMRHLIYSMLGQQLDK